MKVKEFMRTNITTIKEEQPLLEFIKLFIHPNMSDIPVVDKDENMIGVVSITDFIEYFLPHSPLLIQELISSMDEEGEKDILSVEWENLMIKDIMKKRIVTVNEEDSIVKAAALFSTHKIRILLVVNSSEKAVGVITLNDVAKAIADVIMKNENKQTNK